MSYDSDGSYMHDEPLVIMGECNGCGVCSQCRPCTIESAEGTMSLVYKLLTLSAALVAVVGTVCMYLDSIGVKWNG